MSDHLQPKVGQRSAVPNKVTYSNADKRLIVELFEDDFPDMVGLLDADAA